ncbi:MAG TPA: hypothetical protein VHC19_18400 [Pirellulales bacterium]|nr:hypothetical protein [Pirellulales bacterium]
MSHSKRFAASLLAGALVVAVGSQAAAQFPRAQFPKFQSQATEPYDGSGSVSEVGPEGVMFKDSDGKTVIASVSPTETKEITVTGTAEPGFLAPGLVVRFMAKMSNKGVVEEKIKKLQVVEPSETYQIGLQADLAPGESLKDAEKNGPVNYVIIGQIRSYKNKQLQIAVPGKAVKAEVADDCEIELDLSNYLLASKGDEVSVKGKAFKAPQVGGNAPSQAFVIAEKLQVTLAKPLTAPGKKKGSARSRRKRK